MCARRAPARTAAVLAASAIASAMRTDDMAEMGEAWARMARERLRAFVSGVMLALSPLAALAFGVSSRSGLGIAVGEAVLLVSIGALRVFLATATGPCAGVARSSRTGCVRRRALAWLALLPRGGRWCASGRLTDSGLAGFPRREQASRTHCRCIRHLVGGRADRVRSRDDRLLQDKDGALRASELSGVWLRRLSYAASRNFDRYIVAPVTLIALRIGDRWIPAADGGVIGALDATGRIVVAGARLPVVPVAIAIAVILTVLVGLISPGCCVDSADDRRREPVTGAGRARRRHLHVTAADEPAGLGSSRLRNRDRDTAQPRAAAMTC